MKTIGRNSKGPAVVDVQQRLRTLGYELNVDGVFLDRTQIAVSDFRKREGLPAGDFIDSAAWSALVDATFALGDRTLYLRMPFFHGKDVSQLQRILNTLGFVVGDADGIFGAHTESALRDFQSSVGLLDDGVVGATTYDAINRLRHAWEGKDAVNQTSAEEHMGFSRAAEVLESAELCFFGTDDTGRDIAARTANLAQATVPFSSVTSADKLSVAPSQDTLMIGIGFKESIPGKGVHVVAVGDDHHFAQRLSTALQTTQRGSQRIYLELQEQIPAPYDTMDSQRLAQHVAIIILDAVCAALSD